MAGTRDGEMVTQSSTIGLTRTPNGAQPDKGVAVGTGNEPELPELHVVLAPIDAIIETPKERNSRVQYDRAALDELVASIRQHGVLQPILVRPAAQGEALSGVQANGNGSDPAYVVIAGNRRLRAAREAGLATIPCTVRVTDVDEAFILNVVENLQRRELSGRERVRALTLLAGLTEGGGGRSLGVRGISRRTGLAVGTISTWLRIHRHPLLEAALEEERLDIGRAMILVSAPDEYLGDLIERAPSRSQSDLAAEVTAAKQAVGTGRGPDTGADERAALDAYAALLRVQHVSDRVRRVLTRVQQRLTDLLAE